MIPKSKIKKARIYLEKDSVDIRGNNKDSRIKIMYSGMHEYLNNYSESLQIAYQN